MPSSDSETMEKGLSKSKAARMSASSRKWTSWVDCIRFCKVASNATGWGKGRDRYRSEYLASLSIYRSQAVDSLEGDF